MLIGIKWERVPRVESSPFLQSEKNFSEKASRMGVARGENEKKIAAQNDSSAKGEVFKALRCSFSMASSVNYELLCK
jgi:hypothetical protein